MQAGGIDIEIGPLKEYMRVLASRKIKTSTMRRFSSISYGLMVAMIR